MCIRDRFTGDPIFCTVWTYCGMPSISLPLLQGKNGLPIGVQIVSSLFGYGSFDEISVKNSAKAPASASFFGFSNVKASFKLL